MGIYFSFVPTIWIRLFFRSSFSPSTVFFISITLSAYIYIIPNFLDYSYCLNNEWFLLLCPPPSTAPDQEGCPSAPFWAKLFVKLSYL